MIENSLDKTKREDLYVQCLYGKTEKVRLRKFVLNYTSRLHGKFRINNVHNI